MENNYLFKEIAEKSGKLRVNLRNGLAEVLAQVLKADTSRNYSAN